MVPWGSLGTSLKEWNDESVHHPLGSGPGLSPRGTVLEHPVEQGTLETDIVTKLLALKPFMTQNLVPFRQKLPVESGVFQQITRFHWCVDTRH